VRQATTNTGCPRRSHNGTRRSILFAPKRMYPDGVSFCHVVCGTRVTDHLSNSAGNKPGPVVADDRYGGARRRLVFDSIDDVMPEVRSLAAGYRTVGNWSLGQIGKHLTDSFNGSIDGFDLSNHRIKRFFIKKKMLEVALTKGIPLNYTVDPKITPPRKVDEAKAIDALEHAIRRYLAHVGPLKAHPLFGKMPRETWDRVHRVHCAHHLSFVWPTA
jgi:hypothetical protein